MTGSKDMGRILFAFMPALGHPAAESLLLARSMRRFAGELGTERLWAMDPRGAGLPGRASSEMRDLAVEVRDFGSARDAWGFPFAAKVFAAAEAEEQAQAQARLLVWMDSDTVFTGEPKEFLLAPDRAFGFRPVMHTLIGSPVDGPVDEFWSAVYAGCGTSPERAFPVRAPADGALLRAYFNAGLLVVRPERGVLRRWRDNFERLFRLPEFEAFYAKGELYRVFIHQAILAASVVSMLTRDETVELPPDCNYPVPLLKGQCRLNDLTTFRYDGFSFFDGPGWPDVVRVDEPLRGWLLENVGSLKAAEQ